jgi:hypothetical protein
MVFLPTWNYASGATFSRINQGSAFSAGGFFILVFGS